MSLAPHIIIMAAGRGKRMYSDLPKVIHPVLFRPMLHYVLDLAHEVSHRSVVVVTGYGQEMVKAQCKEYSDVQFVTQEKQLGTADAVRTAKDLLSAKGGSVLVLSGDVILLSKETLTRLLETHERTKAACTLITAEVDKPKGYGRILRDGENRAIGIREEADCDSKEKKIREVNAGIYCFEMDPLFKHLEDIQNKNRQEEYYLTDIIEVFVKAKLKLEAVLLEDSIEMSGINDRYALCQVESYLKWQVNKKLMLGGVTMQNPDSIHIDPRCRIEKDVTIEQGCQLIKSVIESGVVIESHCRISDSIVGAGSRVKQGSYISASLVGKDCSIGPYAHLRPASQLGAKVKIGNFVELKKTIIRDGAKASHLSYIGDADIGKNVNIGCGFITCNFDGGPKKHRTVIEDDVFVGSDSQTVAPVTVGAGSYVASGSTVTEDVPPDSLVISRGRQVTKPGYAKKYRKTDSE